MSETGNSLQPGPGAPPDAAPPQDPQDALMSSVKQAHSSAKAQVAKLQDAKNLADALREQMDKIAGMGDNVTPEDVIKGAGAVVGKGGDPMTMAGLLADMPQGGQAIAAWAQAHDQTIRQQTSQVDQALAGARHQAGAAALHLIALHHISGLMAGAKQQGGLPASAPAQPNSLGATPNG